ncbi:hypothetical protein DAETH_47370 (plasmid) [Deinococcus aetherius]|uniref:Uncharacterized protein n=1 Tax=Deinococcus aetherius TaxID=200252 RepID=A0ABN6RS21_9DEIO|nr:hypothetical protein DAETH_47370 [Deinococcus aetherius]
MRLKTGEPSLLDPPDEAGLTLGEWRVNTSWDTTHGTRSVCAGRSRPTTQHLTPSLRGPAPPAQVWIHADGNRQGNLIGVCRDEAIFPEERRLTFERARQGHQQRHKEPHAC